jgi:hypothetical protein
VKTNVHKRKRQLDDGSSMQTLHELKKRVTEEAGGGYEGGGGGQDRSARAERRRQEAAGPAGTAGGEKVVQPEKEEYEEGRTMDESMAELVMKHLRKNGGGRKRVYVGKRDDEDNEDEGCKSNSSRSKAVMVEDLKMLTARATHKSIYSANFIASLFNQ